MNAHAYLDQIHKAHCHYSHVLVFHTGQDSLHIKECQANGLAILNSIMNAPHHKGKESTFKHLKMDKSLSN
jgi:hypothetical protein